jgi:hypothetical protein
MSNSAPIYFGLHPNDLTPTKTSVRGEAGWFTVPLGWYFQTIPGSQEVKASPNADFSKPVYYCTLDDSMQRFAFQDLLLEKMTTPQNC